MHIQSFRPSSLVARGGRRRCLALVSAVLAAGLSSGAWADEYLPALGGSGGGRFEAHCPANQFLAGFDLHAGDDVDAIRPLCVVAYGPRDVSPPASESNWYGGAGGRFNSVGCTMYKPIVTGMYVAAEGADTVVVNNIHLYCGLAADRPEASDLPSAVFDAPKYKSPDTVLGIFHSELTARNAVAQHCPTGQVAVGVHGRSGLWVDAIGLICGVAPRTSVPGAPAKTTVTSLGKVPPKTTVTSLGKVKTGIPSKSRPPQHICDSARDARGRNSPAAPNLEAQCLAAGGPPPATPVSPPTPSALPAPPSPSPESEDSKKRASRDAALVELIGSVVSSINQSQRDAANNISPRGPVGTSANGVVEAERNQRRRDPYPRSSQSATQVNRGPSAQELSQPDNSIRVEVRYPTAYGYRDAAGMFDPGPNSCGAFYISAFPVAEIRPRELTPIATENHMRSSNGAYVCEYLISGLSLNQSIAVRVAMSDQRAAGSEVWLGGSQAQPPAGQRRTIVEGDRQVVLTANRPRTSLSFEMAYSGSR